MDHRAGWASPLRDGRGIVSEHGVVNFVDKDTEEGGGLVVWVRLYLRIDLNDECRSDSGKEAGLVPPLARVHKISSGAHKYQGCVQIFIMFLEKFFVVFLGHFSVVLIKLGLMILLAIGGCCVLFPAG